MAHKTSNIDMIENDFSDKITLTPEQAQILTQVRNLAKDMAYLIIENCHANEAGVNAYQSLRASVFWAEAALASTNLASQIMEDNQPQ